MEKEIVIPEEIQQEADKLFPHHIHSVEGDTAWLAVERTKRIYIQGMMTERSKHRYISDSKDVEEAMKELIPIHIQNDTQFGNSNHQVTWNKAFKAAIAWRDKQSPVSQDLNEFIDKALSESFVGWSEYAINGYKTAMERVRHNYKQSPVGGWSNDTLEDAYRAGRQEGMSIERDEIYSELLDYKEWLKEYKKTHTLISDTHIEDKEAKEWDNALIYAEGATTATNQSLEWIEAWRKSIEEMREWLEIRHTGVNLSIALRKFNELFPPIKTNTK